MSTEQIANLAKPVMAGIFLLSIAFFAILSTVLNYHWTRYEINNARILKMRTVYFSVSGVLLMCMLGFFVVSFL